MMRFNFACSLVEVSLSLFYMEKPVDVNEMEFFPILYLGRLYFRTKCSFTNDMSTKLIIRQLLVS